MQNQYKYNRRPKKTIISSLKTDHTPRSFPAGMQPNTLNPSRVKTLLLLLSFLLILYLISYLFPINAPPLSNSIAKAIITRTPISRRHVLFAIASSSKSLPRRQSYIRLWYSPDSTRALAFLDSNVPDNYSSDPTVPRVVISADTSKFPYTDPRGLRSAIRVARVVKEAVDLTDESDGVRWFVFGDDDTVFFVDNLVRVLSKYDDNRWFYVGSSSEDYEQNVKYSFNMAFGGAGFAISHSLARVLARVLDSCLIRYPHLYGSDARIFSCLAELGVGLTHEPGFHQVKLYIYIVID